MANVVIVSSEPLRGLPAGGITTFIGHFGKLLLDRGDDVTWLIADPSGQAAVPPALDLASRGAHVVGVPAARPGPEAFGPQLRFVSSSRAVAEHIPADADVVYFQDWGAQGFAAVRRRRLLGRPACPLVTVMHGGSEWLRWGMQVTPQELEHDVALTFAERYAVQNSDLIAAPGDAMRRWLIDRGWELDARKTSVLGYPVTPRRVDGDAEPSAAYRRLIYFGRLQTVKGIELFVEAVRRLSAGGLLSSLDEVVLLGGEAMNRIGRAADVVRVLERAGVSARALTDRDSAAAQAFLAAHRADALVVVPSLIENLPYAVIEASLVPGLNILGARVGGVPEILADSPLQLFEPQAEALAEAIAARLAGGPLGAGELVSYDAEAANERWLAFHERALESGRRTAEHGVRLPARAAGTPLADVCVVHRDEPRVAQLLASLAAQTVDTFGVTVVDDASEPEALAGLDALEELYRPRGWRFVRGAPSGRGAARNAAARFGDADMLLFADAADVLAPTCIERFAHAAEAPGVDCLSCHAAVIADDGYPLDGSGRLRVAPVELVEPIGGPLATALVRNPYGLSTCLVRRVAFEAVGGFSEDRWIGHEDYELYVRLALAGHDADVVPETLVYHRRRPASVADAFRSHERILRAFRQRLATFDLAELPDAVCGLWPPVAPDVDSPVAPARAASLAELGRARLESPAGWRAAAALASDTSYRVLVGALMLKVRGRRASV